MKDERELQLAGCGLAELREMVVRNTALLGKAGFDPAYLTQRNEFLQGLIRRRT